MSAAYDQELCARLAKEARAAANSGLPGGSGLYGDSLTAMADQLEAARREIERLVEVHAHAAGVITDEQLLMRPVVEAAEAWRADNNWPNFHVLVAAIDAYRAAKGKT